MRIAILADAKSIQECKALKTALEDKASHVLLLKISEAWKNEQAALVDAMLKDVSHMVFVLNASVLESSTWLPFFVGYARGKGRRIGLFRTDPTLIVPPWLSGLPLFDTAGELSLYFEVEKEEWYIQEERTHSRIELLEHGISWHTDSFIRCIEENDEHSVMLFLKSGYHADVRDKHGVPALCIAARKKHAAIIGILLAHGATIDLQSEDRGFSALMDAVQVKDRHIAQILLANGANPNLASKDGQTALIIAVGSDDFALVELLLQYHADPDIADKLGMSARAYAKLFKKVQFLDLFASCAS